MTHENETKPLSPPVIETTPDVVSEGEPMLTLEERFETFKALTEERLKTINATLAGFKSSDEIDASIDRAVQTHFGRIETLVNAAVTEFGSAAFVVERMDAVTEQLNQINEKMTVRTTDAAATDRKLDLVVRFINTLAADDVTNPESKKTSKSWFERMEESIKTSDERSLATAIEFSQGRVDYAESMHTLNDGIGKIDAGLAKVDTGLAKIDAANEAVAELKILADQFAGVLKTFKRLRENPLEIVGLVVALGTSGYAVPEAIRAVIRLLSGG